MATATVNAPAAGKVYEVGSDVFVSWTINQSNRPQTNAQVELTKPDSTTATTTINGSTANFTYSTAGYASGQYKVRVRVKVTGDADYDSWSAYRSFYVYDAPTVSITLPVATDNGTVSTLPLQVGFTFSDANGSFSQAGFTISHTSGGQTVGDYGISPVSAQWTESGGTYSMTLSVDDFLPANSTTYTVTLTAWSTTGISTAATRVFKTQWSAPNAPNITVAAGSNATASITYGWTNGGTPVTATALYRVDDEGDVLLEQHTGTSGTVSYTYTDRIPPLDQTVTYKACAFASSGAYSQKTATVTVASDGLCYFNWGEGDAEFAAFAMDLAWSTAIEPKRALYEVIGYRDPVLRTTDRRTKTLAASGTVWWDDDAQLEALQDVPGRVWFREPRGHSIPVAVSVNLSYPKGTPVTGASVTMTQVAEG